MFHKHSVILGKYSAYTYLCSHKAQSIALARMLRRANLRTIWWDPVVMRARRRITCVILLLAIDGTPPQARLKPNCVYTRYIVQASLTGAFL